MSIQILPGSGFDPIAVNICELSATKHSLSFLIKFAKELKIERQVILKTGQDWGNNLAGCNLTKCLLIERDLRRKPWRSHAHCTLEISGL